MYRKAEQKPPYILPSYEEIRCRYKVWWFVCKHNPRFLLKTSNRILNPAQYAFPAMCSNDFYISYLRRSVVCDLNRSQSQFNTRSYQPAQVYHPVLLSEFNLISRTHLLDKISQMYTSSCPTDIISLLNLLNEFYLSSLPGFSLLLINPFHLGAYKIAWKQPAFSRYLKKPFLDPVLDATCSKVMYYCNHITFSSNTLMQYITTLN